MQISSFVDVKSIICNVKIGYLSDPIRKVFFNFVNIMTMPGVKIEPNQSARNSRKTVENNRNNINTVQNDRKTKEKQ